MPNRQELGCPHWPEPCPILDGKYECGQCKDNYSARKSAELAPHITAAIDLLESNGYVVGIALDASNMSDD